MKHKISHLLGFVCFLTAGLYLLNVFISIRWVEMTYSFFIAVLLLNAIVIVRRSNQIIAAFLLVAGFSLYFAEKIPFETVVLSFGKSMNLLTIFLFVPLLALFISVAGYTERLKQKMIALEQRSKSHPYRFSFLLTVIMGTVLNLGSLSVIYTVAERCFSNYYHKKLMLVILRAFGFCMLWSPYFVNIGLVLVLFHVTWFDFALYGLLIASVYALVSALLFPVSNFKNDRWVTRTKKTGIKTSANLYPLYLFGAILLFLSLIFDALFEVNMLTVVSLLGFFYPLIWAVLIRQFQPYIKEFVVYIKTSFQRLKNEIVIFVSAGFFGAAISQTKIGSYISAFIFHYSFDSILLMSYIVIFLSLILALIGIHPVVIFTGIGSALSPETFGVSGTFMALLFSVSWTLSTQLSPFSGSVLMAGSLTRQSPWEYSKQNCWFVLILIIVLPLLLVSLHTIGAV